MNSQFHDEFVALTALFYAGELTEEEWALLQIHLAYCDSCRTHFEQLQQITSDVIPAMAASAAGELHGVPMESTSSLEAAERRLMSHVNTAPVDQKSQSPRLLPWRTISGVLAACTVGIAALIGAYHLGKSTQSAKIAPPVSPAQIASPSLKEGKPEVDLRATLESAQKQVSTLQQQLKATEDRSSESSLAAANAEHQLQTERTQRDQIIAERDALNQQLASTQADVRSLRDKAAAVQSTTGQQTAQVDALENQVHLLNASLIEKEQALDEKDRMLSVDKDFLAHDRDIRDVIGARNLYIADIFDTGANGKTAKPFGRIFYTKDSSLIFYGFDLDKQPGLERSAAFQVWGSGSDRQTVNLGLFYQDDSHKRWVLRCNDTKSLARLNMVFVTVEPPGGSSKPTGKQLLRAYLQIQPNHP